MVQIETFGVEQWMDEYETIPGCINVAETCAASISVNELVGLCENKNTNTTDILDPSIPLTYGEIRGDSQLRENLARLYSSKVGTPLPADNILIQPGAISANFVVFTALVGPGDHVICHYPTYQALYSVPKALGAEVDLWRCHPENDWLPSIDDLKTLIKPHTKMIVLNNPQNPTGAVLPKSLLEEIIALASEHSITVLSDEVYRPLFHGITPMSPTFPPTVLSLGYANTIATGSLSKAYSLAGIRVGWIASRSREIIEKCANVRDYTTISVGVLDQRIAAFALGPDCISRLLTRNIDLCKTNLELLEKFVNRHDEECQWTKPVAGTTAFVKFMREGKPVDGVAFCKMLMEETKVMVLPGSYGFGEEFKGYVRFGYANKTEIVREGLDKLRTFMKKHYDDVPLAE